MNRLSPGAILNDKYKIFDLRTGEMGYVLFCHDLTGGPDVALKSYLETEESTEVEKRFIREAEAWVRLGDRPFLLPLHGIVHVYGRPYLLMPYYKTAAYATVLNVARFHDSKTKCRPASRNV